MTNRNEKSYCSLKIEPTLISCGKFGYSGVCNKKILLKSFSNPLNKVKYLIDVKSTLCMISIKWHSFRIFNNYSLAQYQSTSYRGMKSMRCRRFHKLDIGKITTLLLAMTCHWCLVFWVLLIWIFGKCIYVLLLAVEVTSVSYSLQLKLR